MKQSFWMDGGVPANTLVSAQWHWLWISGSQNSKRINVCCVKPPSLW